MVHAADVGKPGGWSAGIDIDFSVRFGALVDRPIETIRYFVCPIPRRNGLIAAGAGLLRAVIPAVG